MMPSETECIVRHATGKQRLAEIGAWEGGTTRLLRKAMSPNATLFGIDPYAGGRLGISYQRLIAKGEVEKESNGVVLWLRQDGARAARNPRVSEAPFDFILIDGEHTYDGLRRDWEAWSPLMAPRGVVALHDSVKVQGQAGAGSVDYSNDVIVHDPRFEPVEEAWTLRVLRRKP
jgi:predicted O-methyltransferase YrrM